MSQTFNSARPRDAEPRPPADAGGLAVLLLNYEYPPLGGGAGVATAALAAGLAARGARVHVVTAAPPKGVPPADYSGPPSLALDGPPGLTVHRVRCRRTGLHEATMLDAGSYVLAALPVVERLLRRERPDIVHLFFSLPTGLLLPLVRAYGARSVVSLRGSDVPGYDPSNCGLQRAHRLLRPLTRWIWRRADRVVALSAGLGELARRTDPSLRFSVIHNGVDLARFRPRAPHGAADQPVRCVSVARLVERKGLDDLLRALALLEPDRYRLEIVGSGPAGPSLRALAAALGVSGRVRFAGALDRDGVADRLRRADIFTLPSRDESFGNAFAEALASGLPVVGTAVGGIPEFVHHGEHGFLVPPGDPVALAAAIRRLGEDPALRALIAARNRAYAQARLSWDAVADRYLALYAQALRRAVAAASPASAVLAP